MKPKAADPHQSHSILRLRRQWLASRRSESPISHHFLSRQLGSSGYYLHYHIDTIVRVIRFPNDVLAIVLGAATFPYLDLNKQEVDSHSYGLESFALDSAGCYVAIIVESDGIRLFSDAAAIAGVYYSSEGAASTPTLLTDTSSLAQSIADLSKADDWSPGDSTPYHGVKWLLANHELALPSQQIRRFWPTSESSNARIDGSIAEIGTLIRSSLSQTHQLGRPIISITGGRDSRVNLAASLNLGTKFEYFTLTSRSIKKCDYQIPLLLASRYNLNHRFISVPPPKSELLSYYDEITAGMAVGARRAIISALESFSSHDLIHINGNLGALFKAYYWPRSFSGDINEEKIYLREFSRIDDRKVDGIRTWRSTLPQGLRPHVYFNLMYLEQRAGRWMGPGENGSSLFYASFTPLSSRRVFNAICNLDLNYQQSGKALDDLVAFLCPELNSIPYCRNRHSFTRYLPPSVRGWGRFIKRLLG